RVAPKHACLLQAPTGRSGGWKGPDVQTTVRIEELVGDHVVAFPQNNVCETSGRPLQANAGKARFTEPRVYEGGGPGTADLRCGRRERREVDGMVRALPKKGEHTSQICQVWTEVTCLEKNDMVGNRSCAGTERCIQVRREVAADVEL